MAGEPDNLESFVDLGFEVTLVILTQPLCGVESGVNQLHNFYCVVGMSGSRIDQQTMKERRLSVIPMTVDFYSRSITENNHK